MGDQRGGAYGFRLVPRAWEGSLPGLLPAEPAAPQVELEWRHASPLAEREQIDPDRIVLSRPRLSLLDVRREPAAITLELPEPVTADAIVHPLLTPPIAILARWRGDLTLHAGAFFANGMAWGVIGAREAGKSTTLARLAERGCPILADDLLVLEGTTAHAGPACIDLRPDIAARMPETRFLGEIAGRPRYRMAAPEGPGRAPLGGIFLLDWCERDRVQVDALDAGEGLQLLYGQEYIGLLGPADPTKILELLGTPMWRVRRPADWDVSAEALDRMLDLTGDQSAAHSPARQPE
jgi:hypothetical protein